jgi:Serpin (serine protease inhibitor)
LETFFPFSWVNNATHGKIKQIVSNANLGPETKMIIASALYFKAEWRKMFIEGANMIRDFFPNGKDEPSYPVEMMAHGGLFPYYESAELECRIMGFTYAHGESMMYVIMPNQSDRGKLRQLQDQLTADKIEQLIKQMKNSTSVILFPKLTLSTEMHLKQVLQQTFGLDALFTLGQSDLSLISNETARDVFFPGEGQQRKKRDVKYKVESSVRGVSEPLNLKDLVLRKRISKKNPGKKSFRSKRQANEVCQSNELKNLDSLRYQRKSVNPGLYAEEILHKVELSINERGTEGNFEKRCG